MGNKKKYLFDKNSTDDSCSIRKTRIIIRNHQTGEELFRGHNKVIVSGSAFTAAKHWNITPQIWTPSYNTVLGLDNSVDEPYDGEGIRNEEKICLFAIGTGGCGALNSQVYDVDYTKWIDENNLVPFRYQLPTNDLQGFQRTKYFGRKTLSSGRLAYYFKAFETPPVFKQQYIDGTPIDENIYKSTRTDEVESFVEANMTVTKEDAREYFQVTTGLNEAQINTISLLEAWKKTIDGYDYYQDIRPVTKLNFPNEPLIDLSKGLDITYDVFY